MYLCVKSTVFTNEESDDATSPATQGQGLILPHQQEELQVVVGDVPVMLRMSMRRKSRWFPKLNFSSSRWLMRKTRWFPSSKETSMSMSNKFRRKWLPILEALMKRRSSLFFPKQFSNRLKESGL